MPKGDGTLEALNASLNIYYRNKDIWVDNEKFRENIHKELNFKEEKNGPFLIKKSEIAKYFNLIEYAYKQRKAKITERGIRYYESNDLKSKKDIIMESILEDSFGRNNSVVPSSDSIVDPPKLLIKSIYELDYVTSREFELLLNYIHNLNWDFEQAKKEIFSIRCGNNPKVEVEKENYNKFSDIKFKTFFVNIGILRYDKYRYYLDDYIYYNYYKEIESLSVYNIEYNFNKITDSNVINEYEQEKKYGNNEYLSEKALEIQNNRKPEIAYASNGRVKYKINRRLSKTAIIMQNYRCFIDNEHKTFIDKEDKPYMEGHHLIPMSAQRDFPDINLDRVENIISLCPICHRAVHYGNDSYRKKVLYNLYKEKEKIFRKLGIAIEFEELFNKYYI